MSTAALSENAVMYEQTCVVCGDPWIHRVTLGSGRVAHLCEACFRQYADASVYFIRSGNLVKIGYSRDVGKRFRSLQIGSADKLELWHTVRGPRDLERELHARFAADRAHGEWFHVSESITAYVEGTCE